MTTRAVTMLEADADNATGLARRLLEVAAAVPHLAVCLAHRRGAYDLNDAVTAAALELGQPITGNGNRWTLGNGSRLHVHQVRTLEQAHALGGLELAAVGFHELGHLEPVAVGFLTSRLRLDEGAAMALEVAGLEPCAAYGTTEAPA